MVYAYKNRGDYAMLNFVFSAKSFNDAVRRYEYMKRYREYRKRQADNIVQTTAQLEQKVKNLEDQKGKRNVVLKTEQEQREVLEADRKEKNELVTQLRGKEKELNADIAKRKKEQQRIQASIRSIIAREMEEARKRAAAEEAARKAEIAERRKREEAARKAAAAAAAAEKENNNNNNTAANNPTKPATPVTPPPPKETPKPEKPVTMFNDGSEFANLSGRFEDNKGKLPWPVISGTVVGEWGSKNWRRSKLRPSWMAFLSLHLKGHRYALRLMVKC
ncbi:hypothetical protein MKQ70_24010 [Chitinophaga sedimenti]|uniref:murein hydrolase activator EnvC family protein n=1 Tax=Chitinophaga sedimenti TaxID=2033606 RepID=UPI002003C4CC|nr:hypothetical protein [Chitinophaga sedimenti]MCK7557907.1 hypothetical protein [Chitinophaga sedimenti]